MMKNFMEITTFSKIKALMKERLSANPVGMGLNPRIDESPEDIFEEMTYNGLLDKVVLSLNELLCEFFNNINSDNLEITVRFLKCALRLCSVIPASDCKTILKLILLENNQSIWGADLLEIQKWAAYALLSFSTDEDTLKQEKNETI